MTRSTGCPSLFETATVDGTASGTQPTDTATAAINIAHHPGANATKLYTLSNAASVYAPALSQQPNDFSVAVNFSVPNSSWAANSNILFRGAHKIAVDANGSIWIPGRNNSESYGLMKLSNLGAVVSPPNGYVGGGLVNPWGVAIDPTGNVWVTDIISPYTTAPGLSVSEFSNAGIPLSPATGFVPNDPQLGVSIAIDGQGNAWLPYGHGVAELSSGGEMIASNPSTSSFADLNGIAIDQTGHVWTTENFPNNSGFFLEFPAPAQTSPPKRLASTAVVRRRTLRTAPKA